MTAVYRGFDQAELDRQYTARTTTDWEDYVRRCSTESARVRRAFDVRHDIAYGSGPDERLDIFPCAPPSAPVLVFIHGGYWRMLSKDDVSLYAQTFVPSGIHYVAVNYSLAPKASIDEIVRQNRAAIAWVWRNARSFGGDPDRVFVAGRSAGGHLVGMMLSTDWAGGYGAPTNLVKGACALSGLYDLDPIRLSYVNEWARLDPESAHRNSPVHHVPAVGCPLILAYGERETDEFKRQSELYAEAWRTKGHPCTVLAVPGHHHFSMMETFNSPDDVVAGRLISLVNGG